MTRADPQIRQMCAASGRRCATQAIGFGADRNPLAGFRSVERVFGAFGHTLKQFERIFPLVRLNVVGRLAEPIRRFSVVRSARVGTVPVGRLS